MSYEFIHILKKQTLFWDSTQRPPRKGVGEGQCTPEVSRQARTEALLSSNNAMAGGRPASDTVVSAEQSPEQHFWLQGR